jgi:PEP-CTERM motif
MTARILRTAVIAAALCSTPWAVRADGSDAVSVIVPSASGTPGSTVDVIGTITNSGPDTLNIDGDNLSVSGPLSVNDEFLTNAPFTLDPGSVSFEFFQIIIGPAATPGVYGTDDSDVFSFFGDFNGVPIEDDVYFTVDVTAAVGTTAPEPSSLLMLGLGVALLGFLRRRAIYDGESS